ncbi:type II toxin-antitoxin system HipA family toxin, partial [Candidatus Fermentibacteria bacterium]
MTTLAEVTLWGSRIGVVALSDDSRTATFQYDQKFSRSGIQISPLEMPLSNQLYSFPELSQKSFHGLPGLLSDSLPDRFGNALINRWLAR